MDTSNSFRATILFGALTLASLLVVAIWQDNAYAALVTIAAMALSYVTQCLVTTRLFLEERAYGPAVTADDDGAFDKIMRGVRVLDRIIRLCWAATCGVAFAAFLTLVLA